MHKLLFISNLQLYQSNNVLYTKQRGPPCNPVCYVTLERRPTYPEAILSWVTIGRTTASATATAHSTSKCPYRARRWEEGGTHLKATVLMLFYLGLSLNDIPSDLIGYHITVSARKDSFCIRTLAFTLVISSTPSIASDKSILSFGISVRYLRMLKTVIVYFVGLSRAH